MIEELQSQTGDAEESGISNSRKMLLLLGLEGHRRMWCYKIPAARALIWQELKAQSTWSHLSKITLEAEREEKQPLLPSSPLVFCHRFPLAKFSLKQQQGGILQSGDPCDAEQSHGNMQKEVESKQGLIGTPSDLGQVTSSLSLWFLMGNLRRMIPLTFVSETYMK